MHRQINKSHVELCFHQLRSIICGKKYHKNQICKANAFTLAETLITMMVIGIVATMTIPSLVERVQEEQYRVAWKKAFSELSLTSLQIASDNGGTLSGLFANSSAIISLYSDKLKVDNNSTTATSVTLIDGTVIKTNHIDTSCDSGWGTSNFGQNLCIDFNVDITGAKGPNVAGKDMLWVGVKPDGSLLPGGSSSITNSTYSCPNGDYCNSYKYLYSK